MAAEQHLERDAQVRWVPVSLMRVSSLAQREMKKYRVDKIVAHFDVEKLGIPTVNKRAGLYYVMDGQHRVEAIKELGWEDQQIQCTVYNDLTEKQEAEMFLMLNDVLTVSTMDRYKVGVVAGIKDAVAIDKIVTKLGLKVGLDQTGGTIKAPGTLRRIIERSGPEVLEATLKIITDAYGDSGLQAAVIDGVSLLVARYVEDLDGAYLIERLGNHRGGVSGLLSNAEIIRKQTGAQKGHSVAAAAVQIYNSGRGGPKKLTSWWKQEQ